MTEKKTKVRSITSQHVLAKPKLEMTVPFREVDGSESLVLGFRSAFVTVETETGMDGLFSGAGLGSPWLAFEWKGKKGAVHAGELLAAWVKTFSPADAERILGATFGGGIGVTVSQEVP
jgi:hypothetical protein